MLTILKTGQSAHKVPPEKVQATYGRYRIQALLSVFLGYLAYYIVRNNFTLSTPYLKEQLDLSATQIGLLSSCMLIAYGISKGVMSSLADKASPKSSWRAVWYSARLLTLGWDSVAHSGYLPLWWSSMAFFRAWASAPRLLLLQTGSLVGSADA